MNKIVAEEGEDGEKLKEALRACQHVLVDTEMENGRHQVITFQMSKLDTKIINENLEVFNKLDSAAEINIALGFVLRNFETGEYRFFYAHENKTLFEKTHLLCTKADLISIQGKVEKFAIVEQYTQERQNTKWRFKLITNVTIVAALLKNIPMGCQDSVIPESLLRDTQVHCLLTNKNKEPYKDHLCLFRALAMYMNGHKDLDSHTSRYFIEFISKSKREREREMDDMRREYIKEKGYKVEEMWECEWWESFKIDDKIKKHVRTGFPYKRPLSTGSLLAKIKDGSLFGYVQCDLVVPDELKSKFANFPPIFKNTEVEKNDIGDYMKNYAIENEMIKHPQRMLIASFKLENGTVITPLFKFYLELGLQCTKIYRFVQYSPRFLNFVQSVIDARREGDENPLSGVVAETAKLLGNSSYGYQITDRSRHTITKYPNDEKTRKAINEPLFKRLNRVENDLYEVKLLKSTIEHREPIIVGFFILQYAKLRMLELYYNFCDVNEFEELEMDTDSIYLALVEENLYDCIQPQKKRHLRKKREKMTTETLSKQMQNLISSLERVAVSIENMISGSRGFSRKV